MTDEEYAILKARLIEAREFIAESEDEILAAAVERDEAYVLHAWYDYGKVDWPFLTLEEATDRAAADCSPVHIIGPGGLKYDPYGGGIDE